jgi:hypothetical protein
MQNIKSITAGLFLAIVAMGTTTGPARAVLIDNGTTTIDTVADLEWLDLTETIGKSYNDLVVDGFGGFIADGYHVATTSEVCSLFTSLGDSLPNCLSTGTANVSDPLVSANATLFVNLLGNTFASVSASNTCGFMDGGEVTSSSSVGFSSVQIDGGCNTGAGFAATTVGSNNTLDDTFSLGGVFLARDATPLLTTIPEPGTLAILSLGLMGLGFARGKKPAGAGNGRSKSIKSIATGLCMIVGAIGMSVQSARAVPIAGTPASGLPGPDVVTIDVEQGALPNDTIVTTQFTGVTFGPTYRIFDRGAIPVDNLVGRLLFSAVSVDPFSITFDSPVSAAGFHLRTALNQTTFFEALLSGAVLESFTAATTQTNTPSINNFFGFSGLVFDEIRFTVSSDDGFQMDNIQFVSAPPVSVSEPGMLALFVIGLVGFGFARRCKAA